LILPIAIFSKYLLPRQIPSAPWQSGADVYTVGWTGAYPALSRKRPTASLVSRKVLTPLLGQVLLCIMIQLVGFEAVRRQSWYYRSLQQAASNDADMIQVHTTKARHGAFQHHQLREYDSLPIVLLPVYPVRYRPQRWPSISTVYDQQS